jgi:hypothetical protein
MLVDLVINCFAGNDFTMKVLGELQRPHVTFFPRVMSKPGKVTLDWEGAFAKYRTLLDVFHATPGVPAGAELGRVAVIGFSEGCQGVRRVLGLEDASELDVVIPVDGIHSDYLSETAKIIDVSLLKNYIAYGRLAAELPPDHPESRILAITHSAVQPPTFVSTTETGEVIWNEVTKHVAAPVTESLDCGWACRPVVDNFELDNVLFPNGDLPRGSDLITGAGTPKPTKIASITDAGVCITREPSPQTNFAPKDVFCWSGFSDGRDIRRVANGLSVFGWQYPTKTRRKDYTGNTDHIFQGTVVLPYMVRQYIVRRWNSTCGPQDVGVRSSDGSVCTVSSALGYGQRSTPPAPLDNPFPLGLPVPSVVPVCPLPPAGVSILGRPGDPCWYPGRDAPRSSSNAAANVLAGAAGLGMGWAAYSAWRHYARKR